MEAETAKPDQIVDELLPEDLDWRRMVREYPLPALAAAAVGGFFLGRNHGTELIVALSGFAGREIRRNVNSFLGEDVLE